MPFLLLSTTSVISSFSQHVFRFVILHNPLIVKIQIYKYIEMCTKHLSEICVRDFNKTYYELRQGKFRS